MTDSPAPIRPAYPRARAVIRWIFVAQIVMAGVLVGRDLASSGLGALPDWRPGSSVPRMAEPVRPGDQTRRFTPNDLPARTDTNRPFPETGALPERLEFAIVGSGSDRSLTLTGAIAVGDAQRFETFMTGVTIPPDRVWLRSPGGSVSDALEIGRGLRAMEMTTAMGAADICLSACPYVLAAGVERRVHPDAWVGVHQHYFGENSILPAFMAVNDVQRGQAEVMIYLDEMGIDPLVMRHAMVTPPDEIYLLVPEELTTYRIATEITG